MELIERKEYVDKVIDYLGKGLIIVLTGQRRTGKSCILKCIANRLVSQGSNVIFINKELSDFTQIKDAQDLEEYVCSKLCGDIGNYLLIDEVQDISGFENALRSLQAKGLCDIIITGSNAKLLSGELASYLSGRYIEIHIQGLSYPEFLQFHLMDDSDESFRQYLIYGGLPQLSQIGLGNEKMVWDYLGDVYNTVVMKDVIARENIRNVRFLNDLTRFLGDSIGKNISASSISCYLKSQGQTISPAVVMSYIGYLCNAFIVNKTPRYDIQGKRVFQTNDKYYFGDIGLRNSIVGGANLMRDIEKLLENIVYQHLISRGYSVNVGILRNAEVDFIAKRGADRMYVQVCYLLSSEQTILREFGNLKKIHDDYPKVVVCMDPIASGSNHEGIACRHIREFLLNDEYSPKTH